MTVKIQRPLVFENLCGALFDEELLGKAILVAAEKPVLRVKTIFIHHNYPAISMHGKKIQIHRFLWQYVHGITLPRCYYVHHKDGNRLNALVDNLELMKDCDHPVYHLKGKKQDPEFARRRTAASTFVRYGIHDEVKKE